MKDFISVIKVAPLLIALFGSAAATATFAGTDEMAERAAKLLAEAQFRNFNKAVGICASQEPPDAKSIEAKFDSYMSAFSSGTKAGLLEMYKVESITNQSDPFQPKDIEMQARQGDLLAQSMQASPAGCKKLEAFLASGTFAASRQSVIDGYREYREKRNAYCARSPKPKNCD